MTTDKFNLACCEFTKRISSDKPQLMWSVFFILTNNNDGCSFSVLYIHCAYLHSHMQWNILIVQAWLLHLVTQFQPEKRNLSAVIVSYHKLTLSNTLQVLVKFMSCIIIRTAQLKSNYKNLSINSLWFSNRLCCCAINAANLSSFVWLELWHKCDFTALKLLCCSNFTALSLLNVYMICFWLFCREAVIAVDRRLEKETEEFLPQKRSRVYGITTTPTHCPRGTDHFHYM